LEGEIVPGVSMTRGRIFALATAQLFMLKEVFTLNHKIIWSANVRL